MSGRTLIVGINRSDSLSRAARRIVVDADILKTSRIAAGDILVVIRADDVGHQKVSELADRIILGR